MYHDFMVLGGAGLVGYQVCRRVAMRLEPRRITVSSLNQDEAVDACRRLEEEFGDRIAFAPASGDLFVPTDLAHRRRKELIADEATRRRLLASLFDAFEPAYQQNHLTHLIRRHRPEVIVDCVNTATGVSYQDVFDGAARVREWLGESGVPGEGVRDLEAFLLSQSAPQLIRHVRFLHRATTEYQTRVYLKVGTTGTGGMGLNIPYTHSEDKPSRKLLAKTEAAFGHTGLLFLLARTPDAPIVKEIKPAAMIGYRAVSVREARDRHDNQRLFEAKTVQVRPGVSLELRGDDAAYARIGQIRVAVVDTGENGIFTRGEFAAITALGQMEYITPEELASIVVLEIQGSNTGQDVISALDASVIQPSYKAGLLRNVALTDLAVAERQSDTPSIALGRLGPPELSKLLFEAYLFKHVFGSIDRAQAADVSDEVLSGQLAAAAEPSGVLRFAPSIGIPVLLPDGETLLRGPRLNVPEVVGHRTTVEVTGADAVDGWARRGWIDLRPENVGRWRQRFRAMRQGRVDLRDVGSAAASTASYMSTRFEIGEVVAWIFNNEMGGYRVK